MTKTYIALLRGINVGKAKRISMADLRQLVEGCGYANVRTLLNSGNVVFASSRVAGNAASIIEKALIKDVGVSAKVTVLPADELAEVVVDNPILDVATNPSRHLVAFFHNPADRKKVQPLMKQDWGHEAISLNHHVVYLWCPDGVLESQVAKAVNRALGDSVTMRNWATVQKLRAMAQS